ncbi:antibiotic biosynthesis monooxygenase [Variovorax sp. J2P1-59]|uniref:antibiotic biosynthesis monooxygenase n=1 Tax=Variovorax flavidus TaxID=3053501 RepID=UPI0025766AE3|nr:antibiotic biosynthesis monooxygenase [Variovorax sp. J2P1-59]MDM0075538.1 antibiotic biosynthesis monooxygenase [Variovorax sp. J2P1-59]
MSNDSAALSSTPVFRIDKFVVPTDVRPAFIAQMQRVQDILRTLPGCLRTHVLDQTGGTGEFNVLTLVEWANEEAVASATVVVKKKFADEGFDPVAFTKNAGVRSDQGFYVVAS